MGRIITLSAFLCLVLGACSLPSEDSFGREFPGTGEVVDGEEEEDNSEEEEGEEQVSDPSGVCIEIHIQSQIEASWGGYWVYLRSYNELGILTYSQFDEGGDGVDRRRFFSYDKASLLSEVLTEYSPGQDDELESYRYDEEGQLTQRDFWRGEVLQSSQLYSYDSIGRRVSEEEDSDGDGTLDRVTVWSFIDDSHRPLTREVDQGVDGSIDERMHYGWGEDGLLRSEEWDHEADGDMDAAWFYFYEPGGQLSEKQSDADGDGVPDEISRWTYDAFGQKDWRSEDTNADGSPDELIRWFNSYDESQRLSRIDHDIGDDGSMDGWETWEWFCS